MKKIIFASVVLTLLFALTACGSTNSTATARATVLTQEELFLVGTFKLENTALAVTPAQAAELLPLWETLQSMSTSGTGAAEEVDAVVSQIESTMTADQIKSITAMKLTRQDLAAVSLEAGVSSNASSTASSSGTSSVEAANNQGGGNPGAGGPPADMVGTSGGPSDATGSQAVVQAASKASSTQSVSTTAQVTPALLNTLV